MTRQEALQAMSVGESQSNGMLQKRHVFRLPNVVEWVLLIEADATRVVRDKVPFEETYGHWVASRVELHGGSLRSHLRVRLPRGKERYQMSYLEMGDAIHSPGQR